MIRWIAALGLGGLVLTLSSVARSPEDPPKAARRDQETSDVAKVAAEVQADLTAINAKQAALLEDP
jgi:hypothetical protein